MVVKRSLAILLVLLICVGVRVSAQSSAVWIDTDPAMGEPERDVDDGVALIQAFHSPELAIRGVSVVFGNTTIARGVPIARDLVGRFGPAGLRVSVGAASAADLGRETDGSRALAAALAAGPLSILALGPVTNIATVLARHPELASRVTRVVAVAGRRPNQRFTTGTHNRKGHRDFNFEMDSKAFAVLLHTGVPLVLAPFEVSSTIWITSADLDRLAAGPPAARAIAAPARAWLELWKNLFGAGGFNPFDTLAVGYAASPAGFVCEDLPIAMRVLPDDVTEPGMQGTAPAAKPFLLVSAAFDTPARARYCSSAPEGFKAGLIDRLLR